MEFLLVKLRTISVISKIEENIFQEHIWGSADPSSHGYKKPAVRGVCVSGNCTTVTFQIIFWKWKYSLKKYLHFYRGFHMEYHKLDICVQINRGSTAWRSQLQPSHNNHSLNLWNKSVSQAERLSGNVSDRREVLVRLIRISSDLEAGAEEDH